jgi:predicted nucleotidyltransferase component of viral defense system
VNLFDKTVEIALNNNSNYSVLRPVVEKEILHHDILREMNKAGYLKDLTFIGGTCLRICYNSKRLSEDLDFTGGFDFTKDKLGGISAILKEAFLKKYDFAIEVSEPIKETGDTETWKIKIITKPEQKDLPIQRINIDICAIPSYERNPSMIKNHYGIESGTSGMILFAQSLKEILVDKIIAFALRPNRVKNRDIWDIFWLNSRNIELSLDLLNKKLSDRKTNFQDFSQKYEQRLNNIKNKQKDFLSEMRRFLAPATFKDDFISPLWWKHILILLGDMIKNGSFSG